MLISLLLRGTPARAGTAVEKPVQRAKFAEAVKRRAALPGREDGRFEAWVFPVKTLRDFRLPAYTGNALEPTPPAGRAGTIEVHPGHVTITCAHAAFHGKQTLTASIAEPAAGLLLEIDT